MSIAVRLKDIRVKRGLSQREIAKLAGVSHATWSRFEKGYTPISLHGQIIKIAENLGEDPNAILEGMNPKGDFEFTIRHAGTADRREWLALTLAQRVLLTLDFLRAKYPKEITISQLATACSMPETDFRALVDRWPSNPPDRATALLVATAIHGLTGITLSWFKWGRLTEESPSAAAQIRGVVGYCRSGAYAVQGVESLLRLALAPNLWG